MKPLALLILFVSCHAMAQLSGFVQRLPVNAHSVGCGIVKGRLDYLAKTHSEVDWALKNLKGDRAVEVLEKISQRYSESYREDQGYLVVVTWDLTQNGDPLYDDLDLRFVHVAYAGMEWSTREGLMPEKVELTREGGTLTLKFYIDSLNYCFSDSPLSLSVGMTEDPSVMMGFAARWNAEKFL